MNVFEGIRAVQSATLAARTRTNDASIGTQAKGGKLQVVRVHFQSAGRSVIELMSDFMPIEECLQFLEGLQ